MSEIRENPKNLCNPRSYINLYVKNRYSYTYYSGAFTEV